MKKISGGLILYNLKTLDEPKFLIAHPGGPFFKKKDVGWWTIPKGEPDENEAIFDTAIREFKEETGMTPNGPYVDLGNILQKNGKMVYAWGFQGNWDDKKVPNCNEVTIEYPKGTGKTWTFPEIDQAIMMNAVQAKKKLRDEQEPFIDRLVDYLKGDKD